MQRRLEGHKGRTQNRQRKGGEKRMDRRKQINGKG